MEWAEWLNQCYRIGNLTLPLVAFTGFIMGLVITIQSYPSMAAFGAESWLPSVVSVSLVREIVPVITALICAGKIGSGIGAELGSMKVTEQIDEYFQDIGRLMPDNNVRFNGYSLGRIVEISPYNYSLIEVVFSIDED